MPGGLIVRATRPWRPAAHVHLYNRRDSALIVQQLFRDKWLLCVADGEASGRTALTKKEAEVTLRAWLSPLPPPPVERLTDLA